MANLYLLDKPNGPSGLALAAADSDAAVVLIQDGVYLDPSSAKGKVYAVKRDVEQRGVASRLPASVRVIDYGELVDLIMANKVINLI